MNHSWKVGSQMERENIETFGNSELTYQYRLGLFVSAEVSPATSNFYRYAMLLVLRAWYPQHRANGVLAPACAKAHVEPQLPQKVCNNKQAPPCGEACRKLELGSLGCCLFASC